MDGDHDIDRCHRVTEWVLKETFQPGGACSSPTWSSPARRAKAAGVEEVAEMTVRLLKNCVPGRGAGHRVPLGRPVRRGGDRPLRRHEPDRRPAVEARFLLWPHPTGSSAEGMVQPDGKRRRRPARLRPPRQHERPREPRPVESGFGEEGGVNRWLSGATSFALHCTLDQPGQALRLDKSSRGLSPRMLRHACGDPGLARRSVHCQHRGLHGACAQPVQGLLARLKKKTAAHGWMQTHYACFRALRRSALRPVPAQDDYRKTARNDGEKKGGCNSLFQSPIETLPRVTERRWRPTPPLRLPQQCNRFNTCPTNQLNPWARNGKPSGSSHRASRGIGSRFRIRAAQPPGQRSVERGGATQYPW
jgi:hypothetical protein